MVSASSDELEYLGLEEDLEEEAPLTDDGTVSKNLFQSKEDQALDNAEAVTLKSIEKKVIPLNLIPIIEDCDLILGWKLCQFSSNEDLGMEHQRLGR